ncbi:Uncharacterised protein [Neisseria meningitidis]|nr:Uncharacterised protein [Neisseria meningitidis]
MLPCKKIQEGRSAAVFPIFVPSVFQCRLNGIGIESAIGEETRLFLFFFEVGGGVFEFFTQHGYGGQFFA